MPHLSRERTSTCDLVMQHTFAAAGSQRAVDCVYLALYAGAEQDAQHPIDCSTDKDGKQRAFWNGDARILHLAANVGSGHDACDGGKEDAETKHKVLVSLKRRAKILDKLVWVAWRVGWRT